MSVGGSLDATVKDGVELSLEPLIKLAAESVLSVGPVLGLAYCQVLTQMKRAPAGLSGMSVLLEGVRTHVLVGVLSNQEGRVAIARALFQLGEGEQPGASDETDAVGELTNVIAGRIKAAAVSADGTMRLGVPAPLFPAGLVDYKDQATLRVSFGHVPAALVIALR